MRSLEHFILTVGQNNFGNKIPFLLVQRTSRLNLGVHSFSTDFSHFNQENSEFNVQIISHRLSGLSKFHFKTLKHANLFSKIQFLSIDEINNIRIHAKYRQMAFRSARWRCGRGFLGTLSAKNF